MTPSPRVHGFAQSAVDKYIVETTAYPHGYVPGGVYNITIKREAGDTQGNFRFKGFMCQARVAEGSNSMAALGSFISFNTSKAKTMNCSTAGDTLAHKNADPVLTFSAQWIAPTEAGLGSIKFFCTIVLSKNVFYMNQMSERFPEVSEVPAATASPTVSPTSVTTQTQPTTAPTTHAATTTPTSSKHNLATLGQTKFVPPTTATVITQIQSTSVPIIQASIIAASTTQASTTALMSTKDRSITSVALTSITTRRTDVPTQSLTTVTPTRVQEGGVTSLIPTMLPTQIVTVSTPPAALNVDVLLSRANEISQNFTTESGIQMLDDLETVTTDNDLTSNEMKDVITTLDALVTGQERTNGTTNPSEDYVTKFVSMASTLLNTRYTETWLSLNSSDGAPSFLQTMERFSRVTAFTFARSSEENKPLTVSSDKLVLRLTPVNQSVMENISIPFKFNDSTDSFGNFKLPTDVASDLLSGTDKLSVASVVFKDLEKFMPSNTTNNIKTVSVMRKDSNEGPKAAVVSISLLIISASKDVSYDSNYRSFNLSGTSPVTINYLNIGVQNDEKATCVFWQFADGSTPGHWSTDGVATHQIGNKIQCESEHLTSFSVLVAVHDPATSDALSYITYIGCGLSLFFLVITLICLIIFRKYLHADRNFVNINFVIALILALIFFLAGIDQSSNEDVCKAMTVIMHYLFMAVFGWMLCEGILLYLMLIVVFDTGKTYRYHFSALGWGLPLLIIGISFGIRHDDYGTYDYCFLTRDKGLIYAFVAPMAAILLANLVIFIIVLKTALSTIIRNKGKRIAVKSGLRVMAVILPVLGLTWAIGVFAIDTLSLPLAYLFTIFNSLQVHMHLRFTCYKCEVHLLQGVFVFIFHCLLDGGMRNAFRKTRAKRSRLQSNAELTSRTGSSYFKRSRANTEAVIVPLSKVDKHKTEDREDSVAVDIESVKYSPSPETNQSPLQEDQNISGLDSNLRKGDGDGSNLEGEIGAVQEEKALPLVESILSSLSFMKSEYFK
jgi:hypothetical protein